MIEEAESILKSMGCRQLRVRLHHDGIARIEVDTADLAFCFDINVLEAVFARH
jgi:PP-loop superfamily ATP-utilizing enzyme